MRNFQRVVYPFTAIVGQDKMKKGLILNAINPRLGGILIRALGQYQRGASPFASSWPYFPTLVEFAVGLLPFGLGLFVISLFLRGYPFLE